jgi:hypothetical protein
MIAWPSTARRPSTAATLVGCLVASWPSTLPGMAEVVSSSSAAVRRCLVAAVTCCLLLAAGNGGAGPPPPASSAVPVADVAPTVDYRWPLDGQIEVVRGFQPPTRRWNPGHRGVDLAGTPAAVVRAAGAGVVRFAGPVVDRGVVSVDHAGGLRTTYEPVTPLVAAGDRVAAGDPIGLLGSHHSGCPVGSCLHWGLRRGEHYLDPLALLGLGRVRLLPLPPTAPIQGTVAWLDLNRANHP